MSEDTPTPGRDPRDREPANAFLFFPVHEAQCACGTRVYQWRSGKYKKSVKAFYVCCVCAFEHFRALRSRLH